MVAALKSLIRRVLQPFQRATEGQIPSTVAANCQKPLQGQQVAWKRPARPVLPMILPKHAILVWNDAPEAKKSKAPTDPCISLVFAVSSKGTQLPVALKRPVSEDFVAARMKIQTKLLSTINPVPKKSKSAPPAAPFVDSSINIDFEPNVSFSGLSLGDVLNTSTSISIAGVPYSILREPSDISLISCPLVPIADCPILPSIDYRNGCQSSTSSATIHWFVQNETVASTVPSSEKKKKKNVPVEPPKDIHMTDESIRSFTVPGCEFRATALIYYPSADDVGKHLVMVADLGPQAIVRCGISKNVVQVNADKMIFEDRLKWCERRPAEGSLRLVSYNILASLYLNLSLDQDDLFFPYCPKEYQQYEYRYPSLLREIRGYAADLFFLQEVDHRMQMRYLSTLFEDCSLVMCYEKKRKDVNEGLVIAYNKDKFRLLSSESFWLSELLTEDSQNSDVRSILETSQQSLEIIVSRPTIVQVVVIEDLHSNDVIICANTHLHHDPKHEHLKAVQAVVAVRKIESIRSNLRSSHPDSTVRLLFAGDFNSTPDGSVYRLFTTGRLEKEHECWKLDENIRAEDIQLSPDGRTYLNLTGTPEYTNYTQYRDRKTGGTVGFKGTLDYIWTDANPHLEAELVAQAPPISHDDVIKGEALPSRTAPSDHLPLIIETVFP